MDALFLPADELLASWGRSRLLDELDRLLVADERPVDARRQRSPKWKPEDKDRYSRALRILRHWPDPLLDEWIAERALSVHAHEAVSRELMDVLWQRNRACAATAVLAMLSSGSRPRVAGDFIQSSAYTPQESERTMFREAARPDQRAELQYYGLCGLERLGESGEEWLQRISAWTRHPEPRLRIAALVALARRGDPAALKTLHEWTEEPHPLSERAEVICALAELDPAAHVPLFIRAVEQELPWEYRPDVDTPRWAPMAEEAVLALARLLTPETLTPLLRSYLTTPTYGLRGALWECFSAILEAEPGATPDFRPFAVNWRKELRWPWTEAGDA